MTHARAEILDPSLTTILDGVDDKPASYLAAARAILAHDAADLTRIRVSVLSTFTFDLIRPYLVVEGARRGLLIELSIAPFGQLEQQVLDSSSSVYASKPDVVVLAARIEEAAPKLVSDFLALSDDAVSAEIDSYMQRLAGLVRELRQRSAAQIVIWNQAPLQRLSAGFADPHLMTSQQDAVLNINRRLGTVCREVPGATIFDSARLATELGLERWYDPKLAYLARCPISGPGQRKVGQRLARQLRSSNKAPCKCLVLDLDNTLWGGVLGEDGPGGIALGDTYPGSAFKDFQRALRGYLDRGVLLALASKNNEADVTELFAGHAEMILRPGDFAARQIHWNDKASSLRAIASELNIGIDAIAFFDDNPVERAWVREQVPEVFVIEVPKEPWRYSQALDESGAFDHLTITAEDRSRARQYRAEVERKDLRQTTGSVEDFLRALEMRVEIASIKAPVMARVAQLIAKTNQFNVTTRRYSESELASLLSREGALGVSMRITDRYGDNGLVGVAIALPDDAQTYRLDTFLMSCRVLGRQAEQALLYSICRRAAVRGSERLLGEFVPTKKNAPAAQFFSTCGFKPRQDGLWELALGAQQPPPWLQLIEDA
jgi:FkbH-like protein